MDNIQASPRNEALFQLAQKLRQAPSQLANAAPGLGSLAAIGKEWLTEPVARGLEHWAYGDRLTGPPANAPMVNQRTEDMLSALPLGAGSKIGAAASFVPLLGSKGAQAAQLARQGAGSDELWSTLQALRVPRRPKDVLRPNDRFLTEIDDSSARFKPSVKMLDKGQKEQLVNMLGGDPLKLASALRRSESTAMPMPGNYSMGDLIEHPELYKAMPGLDKVPVRIGFDPKIGARGEFKPDSNRINLNLASHMTSDTPGLSGVMGTALHEGGHYGQNIFDLPGGASPKIFKADPDTWKMAEQALGAAGPLDSRTKQQWERLLRLKSEPFRLYRESPGEQLATGTQDRLHLGQAGREAFDPNQTSFTGFSSAVDPYFAHHLLSAAKQVKESGGDASHIAKALREWGTIK